MKTILLTASFVSILLMSAPAWAEEAHHPAKDTDPAIEQMSMDTKDAMDTAATEMQTMREKITAEKDPLKQQSLMHQHMKKMREGMNMMSMMGGTKQIMTQNEPKPMPMEKRMSMMENKMKMMETMMAKKDGMMMGGMMNKSAGNSTDDRTLMMENKIMMMQEILDGMMMQQELKMK